MTRFLRTLLLGGILFVSLLGNVTRAAPEFLIAGGQASTTMPFALIGNHIYLQVMLNGKGPYYFALDSGARDFVTPTVAKAIGLTATPKTFTRPDGQTFTVPQWPPIETAQFGNITLRDQPFAVIPFESYDQVEGVTPFGGLLGYEVLKAFVVTIDYARRTLTFTKPEQFQAPASASALGLTFEGHIPQVIAALDGVQIRFNVDTGDRRSLALFRKFVTRDNLRAKYPPKVRAMTGWGIGGPIRSELSRAERFTLGGFDVARPITEMDLPGGGAFDFQDAGGNIGADILRQFTVTFDYSRAQMFVEKGADFGEPITFDRSGVWLNQQGAQFVVLDVVANGPAAQVGLQVGDTVTAVDGQPSAQLSLPAVRQTLEGAPGTQVTLTVQSKGRAQKHTVTVTLRELV